MYKIWYTYVYVFYSSIYMTKMFYSKKRVNHIILIENFSNLVHTHIHVHF